MATASRPGPPPKGGGLRARLSRWASLPETLHAEHEQEQAARLGGIRVADLELRRRATVCGTLRSVTLRPRAGVPALVAELYDGTGTLAVVWLGRRQIAGVEPGRRMRVEGMVTQTDGRPMLFNPRYELVPVGG
jgi:DNA/RNA endonuclease YhcR with UshA esterase domain